MTVVGALLRLLRLDWQPLWWDEGYSVYFATEPLARMAWLTAHDIHPPLYFALAHGWVSSLDWYGPVAFRLLSVVVALPAIPLTARLARHLLPSRSSAPLLAAALVAFNPMHLFYSQEVRMYGLALTLSLAATLALFNYAQRIQSGRPARRAALIYALWAGLSLYTLYYSGFLLVAHALWLLYTDSRAAGRLRLAPFLPFVLLLALYLPWLLYAGPKLITYVESKIVADEDTPLSLPIYLWRHGLAYMGGHLAAPERWLELARHIGLLAPLGAGLYTLFNRSRPAAPDHPQISAAAWFLLIPLSLGYLVNLVYPFFPVGGERLLFLILPYALLLFIAGLLHMRQPIWRTLALLVLGISMLTGIGTFFTIERYVNEDYRPLIRTVLEKGREQDAVLAIFPWQIGYWRAYTPRHNGDWLPPQPAPLNQDFLVWDAALARRIDRALLHGTLWFPAPLGFGSTLPHEIETHLRTVAANAHDGWISPTTRLSAWTQPAADGTASSSMPVGPLSIGPVTLQTAQLPRAPLSAENTPLNLHLQWHVSNPEDQYRVQIDLHDSQSGHRWASRAYQPLGHYSPAAPADSTAASAATENSVASEHIALLIPLGTPPGEYDIDLRVTPVITPADTLLPSQSAPPADIPDADTTENITAVTIGSVNIITPPADSTAGAAAIALRLPGVWQAGGPFGLGQAQPTTTAGLRLWSAIADALPARPLLAGTSLAATLYLSVEEAPPPATTLSLELRTADGTQGGTTLAATTTWPLPHHPPQTWQPGAIIAAPMTLFVPGYVASATDYVLWGGITTPDAATLQPLAIVAVHQRSHTFNAPPTWGEPLAAPF
ncbi:MAG: hypothetical protein WDZ49_11875, partial [Litorilinea sp.]